MALFGSATATTTAANATQGDLSKDVPINQPPEDGISALSFSPVAEFLAVSSWDKKVRIYEINSQGQSQGKAFFEHDQPVLDCCWTPDGTKVIGAGADKQAKLFDLNSGQNTATQVAAHDMPIKACKFVNVQNQQVLVTGSWDKMIKYWDLRQQTPIASLQCQERVYSMDAKNNLLVIATADRYVNIVTLTDPTKFFKTVQSPLKWQTRTVACFNDGNGFGIGSVEGRCAMQYVEDKDSNLNFSFRCHRSTAPTTGPNRGIVNAYAVNAINFHPVHGTFSTAGGDGMFNFWDKDAKSRLKSYPEVGGTISATCFNRTGDIFAYAVSYDWSKGYQYNTPQLPIKIMLHAIGPEECKPKPKAAR